MRLSSCPTHQSILGRCWNRADFRPFSHGRMDVDPGAVRDRYLALFEKSELSSPGIGAIDARYLPQPEAGLDVRQTAGRQSG